MNTITHTQSQNQQFEKNNGNSSNPYGSCCNGSYNSGYSNGYNNNSSGGSNVGAALGGMAVGAMMASLPREAAPVYAPGPTSYYYSNGGFVTPAQAGSYQVVAPPAGAMASSPPSGAYQTTVNGVTYYVSGSTYYEPVFSNGEIVYRVAQPDN
jgi:hypothetical protein